MLGAGVPVKLRALALLALVVGACHIPPPRPAPVSGAGCKAAGERVAALGCTIAHDFEARCEKAADLGIKLATECLAGATSCEQVSLCR